MKSFLKNNWHSLLLILGTVTWAMMQAPELPDLIPSHFDLSGRPDKFGDKYFNLALLPTLTLITLLLLNFRAKISPKGYDMPNGQKVVGLFNLALTFFLMTIYIGIVLEAKNPEQAYFAWIMTPALGLFMIFIGNYFGKLERNFFIGVRVPWTLASEENWKKTHRFAGKVFVLAGIISLLLTVTDSSFLTGLALLIFASTLSVLYSLYYFLRFERLAAS